MPVTTYRTFPSPRQTLPGPVTCENLCCRPRADRTELWLSRVGATSTRTSEFPGYEETHYLLLHGNSGSFCFLCLETPG